MFTEDFVFNIHLKDHVKYTVIITDKPMLLMVYFQQLYKIVASSMVLVTKKKGVVHLAVAMPADCGKVELP